ncbi:aldose epimerase family protein [Paenibacillus sp. strain BS8-2]
MSIREVDGIIEWTNEHLTVEIDPRIGGKVRQLKSLRSGRCFLYEDKRIHRSDTGYDSFDQSGWDECFPTIRSCIMPVGLHAGETLRDHGIFWGMPFQPSIVGEKLYLRQQFGCLRVERMFWWEGKRFCSDLAFVNEGNEPFVFLADAHISLHWEEGTKVSLPKGAEWLYVYRSSPGAFLHEGTWMEQGFWDRSETCYQAKVFSRPLADGRLSVQAGEEVLTIGFDRQKLPYIGIWVAKAWQDCYGNEINCLSIQPTNYPSATLPPAEWAGTLPMALPGERHSWSTYLEVL